jgi:hypothetical protein
MDAMFKTHLLNDEGVTRAKEIADVFDRQWEKLKVLVEGGDPRCIALLKTELERACFYAKKSIAVQPHFQKDAS